MQLFRVSFSAKKFFLEKPRNIAEKLSGKYLSAQTQQFNNSVVLVGNFDGVHKGHRYLIATALGIAKQENKPLVLVTFSPHTAKFLAKNQVKFLLNDRTSNLYMLRECGIDIIIEIDFTQEVVDLSAADFIQLFFKDFLHVSHIVVGKNFRFGKNAIGNSELLQKYSERGEFKLQIVDEYNFANNIYSSSLVRNLLANAEVEKASEVLGYKYFLQGVVIGGMKLGRTIGVPTANLQIDDEVMLPLNGVYIAYAIVEKGERIYSVVNIGKKPSVVSDNNITVEAHILEYSKLLSEGDLYGRQVRLELLHYLRGEAKFASLEALIKAIEADIASAIAYFKVK